MNFFRCYGDFGTGFGAAPNDGATQPKRLPRFTGLQMGRETLRWAAFLRKLKPGGTFLDVWVVRPAQRRTGEAVERHQLSVSGDERTSKVPGRAVESDPAGPARVSLSRRGRAVTDLPRVVPEERSFTFPASPIPPAKATSELGGVGSVREPLTPRPLVVRPLLPRLPQRPGCDSGP